VGRLKLDPIDTGFLFVHLEARQTLFDSTIVGIAGITLRHDNEIGVELVLHIDGRTVAGHGLVQGNHFEAGALGAPLTFYGLVVEADTANSGTDALTHETAHGHDPAMSGVAVDHHREINVVGNPACDLNAFGHGCGADIGKAGIGTDHPVGTHEGRFAPRLLHDTGMGGAGRMEHRQNLVLAMNQFLQSRGLGLWFRIGHRNSVPTGKIRPVSSLPASPRRAGT
jgi:hypothetical protein